MRVGPWCAAVLLAVTGCGDGEPAPEAPEAIRLLAAARQRFEALDALVQRSAGFRRAGDRFQSVVSPRSHDRAPAGVWRRPGKHYLHAVLPARASGVTRLANGPVTIELRPVGADRAEGALAGQALVYPDAYPGADSIFVAERRRIEELFVLRDERAPRRFEYRIRMVRGGGKVRQLAGAVEALDAEGNAWLRLELPWVADGDGRRHEVRARLREGRLAFTLPQQASSYPMLLDPTWTTTGSMIQARKKHTATRLKSGKVLVVGYSPMTGTTSEVYNPATGTWTGAGSLTGARSGHTATLLPSGQVLVTGGGSSSAVASADLFDPATGKWTTTGSMITARSYHTATLLPSGEVLLTGGANTAYLKSVELYDPAKGVFSTLAGALATARSQHTATLLASGKVLVAGGYTRFNATTTGALGSADVYDPKSGKWSITGSLVGRRYEHHAVLLASGKALVSATSPNNRAELYDPSTGKWSITSVPAKLRHDYVVTVMPDGRVMAIGGYAAAYTRTTDVELYNATTNSWAPVVGLLEARLSHTATWLSSGEVLVAGGNTNSGASSSAELYRPVSGSWTKAKDLNVGRKNHTATLLKSGKVLVAGGSPPGSSGSFLSSAELYDHTTGKWSKTGDLNLTRRSHSATLLQSGKVLLVGGDCTSKTPGCPSRAAVAELYDPKTGKWSKAGSLITPRAYQSAVLLPSGKVLVAGGAASGLIKTAELYDPASGKWSQTGAMTTEHGGTRMTLLPGGKVLIAGGSKKISKNGYQSISIVELYDPAKGTWTATGSLAIPRTSHSTVTLPSGKVLVATGTTTGSKRLVSTELYDPGTCVWSATNSLTDARWGHSTTLLGHVLVAGGVGAYGYLSTAELYDPVSGYWSSAGKMSVIRVEHTATLLPNGKVLVVGGAFSAGYTAEIFDPSNALSCNHDSDCATTFCADKRCCESACDGPCKQCVVRASPKGIMGKCEDVPAGKPDKNAKTPCTASGACDGKGTCKKSNGQKCAGGTDCATGICVDGVCCDVACTGTCKTCKLSGYAGTCTNVLAGQPDANGSTACVGTGACDGNGACKTAQGQPCTSGSACVTGHCADGVCCDMGCSETCKACHLAGKAGTCSHVPASQPDANGKQPCMGANACDGSGACKKAAGQACPGGFKDCSTGFCMDYVCCDTPCTDTCRSCGLSGSLGTCTLVPAGQGDDKATTPCTGIQTCDGKGGCKTATGKACISANNCGTGFCADGHCCSEACGGTCKTCGLSGSEGTCLFVPADQPDANAVKTCTGASTCDGKGSCKKAGGQKCGASGECSSGFCADGVCCEVACTGICRTCDAAGKCGFVKAGKPDDTCKGAKACDGAGSCKQAIGQKCTKAGECGSGFCADGYCCSEPCDNACWSCKLAGKAGTCGPVGVLLPDLDSKAPCSGKHACDGNGNCRNATGEGCTLPGQCATGYCVDSVCCLTSCAGNCQTCYLDEKTRGTCKAHLPNTDPDNDCIGKDKKCGGKCDGVGKCGYPGVGTACGSGPCKACDGAGSCNKAPLDDAACGTIDCDGLDSGCQDYHDLTSERCRAFGKCKAPNDPQACSGFTALQCKEGGANAARDLGPNPGSDSAPPVDDGGCSCRVGRPSPDGGVPLLLALVLALRLRRRPNSTF